MKIVGIYNINNTDDELFCKDLIKNINTLQNDGQEVEVQYQVNSFPNGQIVLSALVLGRK
jgi:hypothetical protein